LRSKCYIAIRDESKGIEMLRAVGPHLPHGARWVRISQRSARFFSREGHAWAKPHCDEWWRGKHRLLEATPWIPSALDCREERDWCLGDRWKEV
jgi:hypothetical protein